MPVEVKFFRVLDRATEISAMVTKILNTEEKTKSILDRCGFWSDAPEPQPFILLTFLVDTPYVTTYNPFYFNDRTRNIAGIYIKENFDKLSDGDTVDVEHIIKNKLI